MFVLRYEGPLLESSKLDDALEKGPKSPDFTCLIAWLSEELSTFGELEERVHPTSSSEDSSSFLLEVNTFLKELGCVNSQLMSGNLNQRLGSRAERTLLLEYLIAELMAGKIIQTRKPDAGSKLQVTIVSQIVYSSLCKIAGFPKIDHFV